MKKIAIFTWHNISSAYSCLIYLKHELERNNTVHLWSFTDPDKIQDQEAKKPSYFSFSKSWYGSIPRFRVYMAKLICVVKSLKYDIIIINDLDFFIPAYFIKKIKPSIKIVHYNTEICGFEIRCFKYILNFYEKHAAFPDLIIECLEERGNWRKKQFGISKPIYTIDNTLPQKSLKLVRKWEAISYSNFPNNNLPIVIYAGGASLTRQLHEILDCVDEFRDKLNFLFFCYGNDMELSKLDKFVSEKCHGKNISVNRAIPREKLLQIMNRCDIGINYYRPDVSINFKYAAPSKFYEYLACGLNIVTTNNEGINKIVENNDIGVCIAENETIGNALDKLLTKGLKKKEDIIKLFIEKYSYELEASSVVEEILK